MSKRSRNELIPEFIAAIRASQTATDAFDHAVADYVGLDRTAYRCLDILDQEGPMTAGGLAERARLSPGAMTALLDRLEQRGFARRTRDTKDRRRVLVEVTPQLRRMAAQLYGTPDEGADALAAYTNEQLEFLIGFLRGNVAYQEERMRRLDALKAEEGIEA
ncbi:MAG TPA: MarR family transcriptional regulator [Gaiellaceae bacterium]|nr:MarR family transcriptional regulator [Gaiellaceae bacterium]